MPEGRTTWRQIADDLRASIRAGEYPAGDQLPSRAQLMDRYGVASQTVLNAISSLRAEGLVVTRPGAGVFVREHLPLLRLARNRLARSERQAGRGFFLTDADLGGWTPRTDVAVRQEPATAAVADDLGVDDGAPVTVRDRVMYADDQPFQLATSYLPADLTAGTAIEQENTGPGGIIARLEEAGHAPVHFQERVTTSAATDDEARRLQVNPGTPLVRIRRIAYGAERPVEVNHISMPAERVELVYEISAD